MARQRSKVISDRPIRVGVFGAARGQTFIQQAGNSGMELAAVCDRSEPRLASLLKARPTVRTFAEFDRMLESDIDAVVLANYFHEHAPFAVRALEAGKHVLSECTPCITMAQAAQLCDAVERSGCIYMFAENYPYSAGCIELARLYQAGEIGQVIYAEGDYIHPDTTRAFLDRSPGLDHWRNRLPATYYCTHALAPLMVITDTMPAKVNALAMPYPKGFQEDRVKIQDVGSIICVTMDNGAVFRLVQGQIPGHSVYYRLHGTAGLMEIDRSGHLGRVRVLHDRFNKPAGVSRDRSYEADFPEWASKAAHAGHGGGDFFTCHYFADAIRSGKQPYLDVYRGVAMSAVGIMGWRSALDAGAQFPLPDWRSKSDRARFKNDHWSPFHPEPGPMQAPSKVGKPYKPTTAAVRNAKAHWAGKASK